MKIFFRLISGGFPLSAALTTIALVAALPASAQDPPPAIVQPGAPGEPTRTLTPEDVAALGRLVHVDADVRFMQGMIHHHGQALDMTDLLSTRTESEEMRLLALRIDISQTDEIGMMARWLDARGEDAPKVRVEEASPTGASTVEAPILNDDQLMPGMLTERQMAQLASATGEAFDRLFLELMIVHHEGALTMVGELFLVSGAGQEPDVFKFASDVDADQTGEIGRMNMMLQARR
jgi:uncharacterized protein (DUF305 family)